jgi:hypothetical protein
MAFNYSPKIVTDGLVLYLDAANQYSYVSGSTSWNDISRGGNNGTLVNGPTFNSANGGSIVFDGVDDFVSGSDMPLRFGNSFSLSSWIYWDGLDKTNISFLSKRNGPSGNYNQYAFTINNGDPYGGGTGKVVGFFAREDGNTSTAFDTYLTYTFPAAGIYNITGIINTTSQQFYINGNIASSSSINYTGKTFNISGRDLLVGAARDNAGTGIIGAFNNKIYNVQIYNRALSATEVRQNYNATKTRFGLI